MPAPRLGWRAAALLGATATAPLAFSACNLIAGTGDLTVDRGAGGLGGSGGSLSAGVGGTRATSSSSSAKATTTTGGGGHKPRDGSAEDGDSALPDGASPCLPYYALQGGTCVPTDPGDPVKRTQTEVCARWTADRVVTDANPLVASGKACDKGMLKPDGLTDTLRRIDLYRWLTGLGPVADDPVLDESAQECAAMEAWWDFSSPGSPHMPPATTKCYTPTAALAAAESDIAWGANDPADAIDQFMQDDGNATTLGHRRWLMNPPLDPVGIGYWQTGGQYGNAECLRVFGQSGSGPSPAWVAMPPPGFTPLVIAGWEWSFHGSLGGIATATITMTRLDDAMPLAVTVQALGQGFAQDAIGWTPMGWVPEAGKSYEVKVSGLQVPDVTYVVKPVNCL